MEIAALKYRQYYSVSGTYRFMHTAMNFHTRQESFFAVATQKPELHGPPSYFTTDWGAAKNSVQRLSGLQPAIIVPAHGQPMIGADGTDALAELAARFDEVARPTHGKYVEHPVRA